MFVALNANLRGVFQISFNDDGQNLKGVCLMHVVNHFKMFSRNGIKVIYCVIFVHVYLV